MVSRRTPTRFAGTCLSVWITPSCKSSTGLKMSTPPIRTGAIHRPDASACVSKCWPGTRAQSKSARASLRAPICLYATSPVALRALRSAGLGSWKTTARPWPCSLRPTASARRIQHSTHLVSDRRRDHRSRLDSRGTSRRSNRIVVHDRRLPWFLAASG
jgi:hypothetical protein